MPTETELLQGLLANITPADLTAFARQVPQRADFLLTREILPVTAIANVKYRTRNRSITVAAARYRAFDTPTPFLRATAAQSVKEGFLPPLGGKNAVEEFQTILDELTRGADDQRLLDAVWDNVENQTAAIYARLELAAGDLLADGKVSIAENGILLEADFGVPPENKPTANVPWTEPDATPLDDERAWIDAQADAGHVAPARAVTSRKVAAVFARNAQYRDTYWGGQATGVDRPTLTPDQVNSVRGIYGLPPITTYDVQLPVADEDTGAITNHKVLPEGAYLLVPPNPSGEFGQTLLGTTAESLVLSSGSNPGIVRSDAAGIVTTRTVEDDPIAVTTKTTAVALPVIHTPENYVVASVLEVA